MGAGVVEASADGPIRATPRELRNIGTERITVASLSPDTVAQTIRVLHKTRIQISDRIPRGLHAAVARHMVEHHEYECITRACTQARAWLADEVVRPRSASLPA